MIDFKINEETCTRCGLCVGDCPARIIGMEESVPFVARENELRCYRCQHCLTICPTGALSILGLDPAKSQPLAGALPDASQLELLIKGRRAVRNYKPENLEPELVQRLLNAACYAPSGINSRKVRFTVVDDRAKLAVLRDDLMAGLGKLVKENRLPEGLEIFAQFYRAYEEHGIDILFRGAPHFLVVSAPRSVVSPVEDCLIALATFEIFAQSLGVGTVWDGLAKLAINDLLPEFRIRLGIPEDHVVGYAMAFGKPAVKYARTAQHRPFEVHRV